MTTVPLVYDLQVTRQRCGPHQGTSMKSALVAAINTQKYAHPSYFHNTPMIQALYQALQISVSSEPCI